ncbi:MAG: Hsp20/alpha crystallin family protein [Pleomorphochaeta sp.]|nr:Hsp20/alpha crystallin family protein [Sphaerochaetaceae bacterium]
MRVYYNNNSNPTFNSTWTNWSNLQNKYPPLDIFETKDNYIVEVELPGFKLEDMNIKLEKHVLRLSSKYQECDNSKKKYLIKERVCKEFERSISVGSDVDEDLIKATLNNGVLKILLPKKKEVKPKQINVAINS